MAGPSSRPGLKAPAERNTESGNKDTIIVINHPIRSRHPLAASGAVRNGITLVIVEVVVALALVVVVVGGSTYKV